MAAFFATFSIIFCSEFFDKTQLLAMTLTSKYPKRTIMAGITAAIILLNLIAVTVGNFIGNIPDLQKVISFAAAGSFLIFSLYTIGAKEETASQKAVKYPAKWSSFAIMLTFFLAELGDKSQLAAVSLSMKYPAEPYLVFFGAVSALVLVDLLGVFAGHFFLNRIPAHSVRWISTAVFFAFGITALYKPLMNQFGKENLTISVIAVVILIYTMIGYYLEKRRNEYK